MVSKKHGKICAAILILTVMCTGMWLPARSAEAGVSADTQKSKGGRTFSLVSIPMPSGSGRRMETISAGGVVTADTGADNFIPTAKSGGKTLLAMVNGAYFNSYYDASKALTFPDNCAKIQGTLVTGGKTVSSGARSTVAFNAQGKCLIDAVTQKVEFTVDGRMVTAWSVNNYYTDPNAVMVFTKEAGMTIPMAHGAVGYIVKNNVVTAEIGAPFKVGGDETVYVYNSEALANAKRWDTNPKIGSAVVLDVKYVPSRAEKASDWNQIVSATGAGPLLVLGGANAIGSEANTAIFQDPKQKPDVVSQRTYIGVKADGSIVLGAGSISFNDLAETLVTMGVVDAMALDGGASSCVYVEGKGYLQKAGRKLNNVIVIVEDSASAPAPAPAPSGKTAAPTASTVYVDGSAKSFEAYTIDGNNYFKLRDLAAVVNGSDKQFEVGYDNATKAITLTSGRPYTPNGTEMVPGDGKAKTAVPTVSKIYKDGAEVSLTVYTLGGSNFFKLRDVCALFDIGVGYDNATRNITMDTSQPYTQ